MYILFSALCFGSYGIWSKFMAGSMNDFFQGWTRSLMILAILAIPAIKTRAITPFSRREMPWVLAYSFPGALVIPLFFYGFTALPIGIATLSFYASLTITGYILGATVFAERMTQRKIAALGLGMIGLVLVDGARYAISPVSLLPLFACCIAGICGGVEVVLTKKLSGAHSPIQLTMVLYAMALLQCVIFELIVYKGTFHITTNPVAWMGNIAHAVASAAAFLLVVSGYKRTSAAVGSIIGLMEIPFGILFGLILFHEPITWSIAIGMICIALASVLPVFGKTRIHTEIT